MSRLGTAVLILSTLAVSSCGESDAGADTCFELGELRRYGEESAPEGSELASGVLGEVRGIAIGPYGDRYILDRSWQKIVMFDSLGEYKNVILGGEGQGPGEFILPMHLTATDRGISVIDYELVRMTEFDWSGSLIDTKRLDVSGPWRHLVRNDTVWIGRSGSSAPTAPFILRTTRNGQRVSDSPPLAEEDRSYGLAPGLAWTNEGLLASTRRPGVWMELYSDAWLRRGAPLFPTDPPPLEEVTGPRQSRVTPAQHNATSIGLLGDSVVVQGFSSLPAPFDWNNPPARDAYVPYLAVFKRTGEHIATLDLPRGAVPLHLFVDSQAERIFVPVNEPFPQVIEFVLRSCEGEARTAHN